GRLADAPSPSERPRTVRHSQGSACWCTQTRSARIAVTTCSGTGGGSGTRHESSNPGRPSPWARAWATRSCPALLPCNRSSLHKRGSEPSVKAATSTIMTPARRAASRRASLNSTTRGCITRVKKRFGVGSGSVNVSTSTPASMKVVNIRSTRPAVASGSNETVRMSFIPAMTLTRSGRSASAAGTCSSWICSVVLPRIARFAYSNPSPWAAARCSASRSAQPRNPPVPSGSPMPSVLLSPIATNRCHDTDGTIPNRKRSWRRQYDRPVGRDGDGVLEVRGPTAVGGDHRPPVAQGARAVAAALEQHRLDRDDEPLTQGEATAGPAGVGDVRLLVHRGADAVTAEPPRQAVPLGPSHGLHRVRDVADLRSGPGGGDAGSERRLGRRDQPPGLGVDLADGDRHRRVPVVPVQLGTAVDGEHVAGLEDALVGDAVHDRVVHRQAEHSGVRGRSPRR